MNDNDVVFIAAAMAAVAAATTMDESDHEEELGQIRQEKAQVDAKRKQAERGHREALAARDLAVAPLTSGTLEAAIRALQDLQADIQTPDAHKLELDQVQKERDDLLQRVQQLEAALRDKSREVDDMTSEYEQCLGAVRSAVGSADPRRILINSSASAPRQAKRLRPAPASTNVVRDGQV